MSADYTINRPTLTADEDHALLEEWRDILEVLRELEKKRGDITGIAVAKDDIAKKWQYHNQRKYEIRNELFGTIFT